MKWSPVIEARAKTGYASPFFTTFLLRPYADGPALHLALDVQGLAIERTAPCCDTEFARLKVGSGDRTGDRTFAEMVRDMVRVCPCGTKLANASPYTWDADNSVLELENLETWLETWLVDLGGLNPLEAVIVGSRMAHLVRVLVLPMTQWPVNETETAEMAEAALRKTRNG